MLNLDVTFRVHDFSYKKLFHPSQYAKVMPIFTNFREILQIKSKFTFANFPNNQTTYHMRNLFSFIFLTFPLFSFIFFKTEKAILGGGGQSLKMGPLVVARFFTPSLLLWHHLVVARAKNQRYCYQTQQQRGFKNPRYYYGMSRGHGRDRLVVARVKNPRYYYQLSSSEG